jgi:hypothetical protein
LFTTSPKFNNRLSTFATNPSAGMKEYLADKKIDLRKLQSCKLILLLIFIIHNI